jgi:hypothetical protein
MNLGSLFCGTLGKLEPLEPGPHGVTLLDAWTKVGEARGSNPGGVFEDPDGGRWYVKFSQSDEQQPRCELLANSLYRALGIPAPESQLVWGNVGYGECGHLGIANRYIEGRPLTPEEWAASADVRNGFVADAFLANHDVIGTTGRNILRAQDGHDYRIDNGSTMVFRAQGQLKDFAADAVPQIDSLRAANPVFQSLTEEELKAQAAHLVETLPDDRLRDLVQASGLAGWMDELHGYGDPLAALSTLIGRRNVIGQRFGIAVSKGWVTISGAHVFINDQGVIERGPARMVGQRAYDRVAAAKKNFKPADRNSQRIAHANEARVAKAVGGQLTGDLKPLDVLVTKPRLALEVKTLVGAGETNLRINMRPECLARKVAELQRLKAKGFCVLIDQRGSGPERVYVRAGMGAFRMGTMTRLKSLSQLRAYIRKVSAADLRRKAQEDGYGTLALR